MRFVKRDSVQPGIGLGPTVGDYALDVATIQTDLETTRYATLQQSIATAQISSRVASVEPPPPTVLPVTILTHETFPSVETLDTVFSVTPEVHLETVEGIAAYNSTSKVVIDIEYPPYVQNGWSGAVGVVAGTGTAIGDGAANTAAWETAVTEWGAQSRIVTSFDFGTFTDWFIPSEDELLEIYNNLAVLPNLDADITAGNVVWLCSSSEAPNPDDATKLVAVNMTDGTTDTVLKLNQAAVEAGGSQYGFVPVRAFDSTAGSFAVGDPGPGGGVVFYDHGFDDTWGRYLEVVDAVDGAWWYDLTDYNTFDADERFYPSGVLDAYPYDGSGIWQVTANAGVCTFPNVGIPDALIYTDEIILQMQSRLTSSGILGPVEQVVISTLTAP
jgi:hypothetical protein